ncbi:hypothetical protein SADUNF_SadunfMtG0011300 (mitochondrion) [Salix dunnii]|uniref:Uncharacterized protein n=1 Tax=Salix dunnii TaxID=1413687 RepID=A0A835MBZ7_9ROSI|nr:hypothetical protein SADUNF_SadunfMtG0011300 [Salix dunnii]
MERGDSLVADLCLVPIMNPTGRPWMIVIMAGSPDLSADYHSLIQCSPHSNGPRSSEVLLFWKSLPGRRIELHLARGKASAVRLHGLNKTWYCTGPFRSTEYTVISVSSGSAFSPISHSFCEASPHFDTREEDRALCLSCIFGIRVGAVRAGRMIHQMNSQNMETKVTDLTINVVKEKIVDQLSKELRVYRETTEDVNLPTGVNLQESLLLSLFTNRGGFGSLSLENEINVARESDVFIKVAWDDRTFSFLWRPHSREHDDVRRRLRRIKLVGGRLFETTSSRHRLKCPGAEQEPAPQLESGNG